VHEDPDFVEAARSAGPLGYALKDSLSTDLVPAIAAVMRGDIFNFPVHAVGPSPRAFPATLSIAEISHWAIRR
jgi:DNA-binding NarL/FixJ family response regulator